jgi:DNA helicase II / ATP-dependent DNA helicase PcrA
MSEENFPWLEGLNPPQREAATYGDGPLLILAGAGSGKTRVIVHRIAHLILGREVDPGSILAVTFTNKAAEEMGERVARLLGSRGSRVWVSTFHKFGSAVLRRHLDKLGYPTPFVIYDESDQMSLIKNVLKALGQDPKQTNPHAVRAAIEKLKRKALPEAEFGSEPDPAVEPHLPAIRLYQERLRSSRALDFGDLLYLTHRLFTERPEVLADYQARYTQVLVDEYQDTNQVQYLLVRQLAGDRGNVCVVGDEDQSIYGWRGANIANILNFERDFPRARVVLLEQNYRSTKTIIEAASELIGGNQARKPKRLWTANDEGAKIRLFCGQDDQEEARWVVEDILRQKSRGRSLNAMAVFYRTHAQSRVIEDALRKNNLPYKVYGGTRFYDRKEVKDALAYLQFLINPADEIAFARVINTPARGIGAKTQELVAEERARAGGDWPAAVAALVAGGDLPSRAQKPLEQVLALIRDLQGLADGPVTALTEAVLERSGYRESLAEEDSIEAQSRLENLNELINAVAEYERRDPEGGARGFLEQVTLAADIDGLDQSAGLLSLMTLHNAKGLEYPAVYIVGLADGLLPHARSLWNGEEEERERALEEERRLCYVGMTRAREELTLSWSRSRLNQGHRETMNRSMFLGEVPEAYLKPVGPMALRRPAIKSERPSSEAESGVDYGDSRLVYDADADTGSCQCQGVTLKPGDRVFHPNYGEGVIKRFEEAGKHQKVVVRFADGTKKFAAAFAPLRPVE